MMRRGICRFAYISGGVMVSTGILKLYKRAEHGESSLIRPYFKIKR